MRPILFDENATTFATNGLGRLDCISCKVTEERNGMYELEAVVPESARHYGELAMSRIIVARPCDGGNIQPFRIYRITKPINGKSTVYAQHISYQLSYIPTMPFSVTAGTQACAQTLAALKSNAAEPCPFNFSTDVTTIASYHHDVPFSIRQRLGGIEGSVLDRFGGEYEWDNYNVILHRARGVQNPAVTLRYGKNITDIEQEEYISNTITGVCPFWRSSDGTEVVTLPERVVESTYANRYPFRRTVPLDLSQSWDTAPSAESLRAAATAAVQEEGMGIPTVGIKVSFVALWQTEEYRDIAPLQRVKLCDKVNVQFEKLGINTTAKVVKTVYDVLAERYESIEIGSVKTSLAQAITDVNGAITTALEKTIFDVKNATAWLTRGNGYVVAVKNTDGSWKELLFMDTNDTATAHNVLRINENGLGFSRQGVGGPYTQAWTLDGRLVVGGTNVPSLTVYDSSNNILFQTSRAGTVWNSPHSRMTANGTISAENAVLTGSLTVKDSDNNVLFRANPVSGVVWNATNSSMSANGTITANNANFTGATITNATMTGSLEVKNGNNTLFKASPSDGVIWNAVNSSMTSDGTITAENATLNGSLTTEHYENKIVIEDGEINGYYEGTLASRIQTNYSYGDPERGIIIRSVNSGSMYLISDGYAQLSAMRDLFLDALSGTVDISFSNLTINDADTYNGDVVIELDDEYLSGIICNLDIDFDGGSASWSEVGITYVSGGSTKRTDGGIIID